MTKIKNFRIQLRSREVLRTLKHLEGEAFDPSWESCIEADLAPLKSLVKPASIYATLTHNTAVKATPLELPRKTVAMSIIVVTIGSALAQARQAAETEGDARRARLLAAAEKEGLDQSMTFALKLINNQAKDEDCELSELFVPQNVDTTHILASLLGIDRIGLTADTQPIEIPAHARLVYVLWAPPGKAAKAPSTSRSSRSRSAEKAAA